MRVILIDDEQPARDRLRRLLNRHADLQIIGEAENGIAGLEQTLDSKPDLLFVDVQMPGLDGRLHRHRCRSNAVVSPLQRLHPFQISMVLNARLDFRWLLGDYIRTAAKKTRTSAAPRQRGFAMAG